MRLIIIHNVVPALAAERIEQMINCINKSRELIKTIDLRESVDYQVLKEEEVENTMWEKLHE